MSKTKELAAKGYQDGKRDARNDQYIQRPQYRTSKSYRDAYGQAHTDAALGAVAIPGDDA